MKSNDQSFIAGLVIGLILCAATFAITRIIVMNDYYKQGQIDALTGKINYHLVTKPDSTRVWEKLLPRP